MRQGNIESFTPSQQRLLEVVDASYMLDSGCRRQYRLYKMQGSTLAGSQNSILCIQFAISASLAYTTNAQCSVYHEKDNAKLKYRQ